MYVLNVRLIRNQSLIAEVGHPPCASLARSMSLKYVACEFEYLHLAGFSEMLGALPCGEMLLSSLCDLMVFPFLFS